MNNLVKYGYKIINMANVLEIDYDPAAQLAISKETGDIRERKEWDDKENDYEIYDTDRVLKIHYNAASEHAASYAVYYGRDAEILWDAFCREV